MAKIVAAVLICLRQLLAGELTARDLYLDRTPPEQSRPLGVRVSVLIQTPKETFEPVDPDHIFRNQDCFALELQANRSAFLYVLTRKDNRKWRILLPSDLARGEPTRIVAERTIRVPQQHCFEMIEPAGTETMLLLLTTDPQDLAQESVEAVDSLRKMVAARDIRIEKSNETIGDNTQAVTTYAVNHSRAPNSKVVVEFNLRHE